MQSILIQHIFSTVQGSERNHDQATLFIEWILAQYMVKGEREEKKRSSNV